MIPLLLAMAMAASDDPRAAIMVAENGWNRAEAQGDVPFLERLLAPEYVSISDDGNVHTKIQLLSSAKRRAGANPDWKAPPPNPSVTIDLVGDVAIVHYRGATSLGIDVFNRRDGRWIAVYSQHTPITGQPDRSA